MPYKKFDKKSCLERGQEKIKVIRDKYRRCARCKEQKREILFVDNARNCIACQEKQRIDNERKYLPAMNKTTNIHVSYKYWDGEGV